MDTSLNLPQLYPIQAVFHKIQNASLSVFSPFN